MQQPRSNDDVVIRRDELPGIYRDGDDGWLMTTGGDAVVDKSVDAPECRKLALAMVAASEFLNAERQNTADRERAEQVEKLARTLWEATSSGFRGYMPPWEKAGAAGQLLRRREAECLYDAGVRVEGDGQ
ncbi:hypothetical protein LWF01_02825 [Saxibacter everestensis]|uniref:Uncharacterized protein n=1 Tax=Saxibacter everestensis TaxID=2909229 RepID=A0ABY8QUK6_9MICO|nr:hypothetical protein LWF01_02825 [Brevibacteriaceae bacterium ZFBP1038]